jgi:hypothetical protein
MNEITETPNFDAQRINEAISEGDEKLPAVDVSGDYERSKEFDTPSSEVVVESKEDEAVSQSSFQPIESVAEESETGAPEAFLSMAQEVNPFIEN